MRKKRILWICNHVTLMDAEVPLLLELGFEVFVPKKFPKGSEFVSCVSKDIYDPSLTIPPEDLALLNTVDFYEDLFSDAVIDAINRNFDIAFVTYYEKPLKLLVRHFPGKIFIRAFGLAGKASYWNVAREDWGQHFLDQMYSIRDRLFFAMSYRNMLKVEKNLFREIAVFLPLRLPETFAQRLKNGYIGTKRQILFVCPKICAVEYYYNVYKSFKRHFWGFPYVIAGNPFGKIADRHLLGYLPRAEFDKVFCESRVMFYHSTSPRHLHYHPLEAIYANQPLIFMSAGMLGQLTPKVKYPGAANSILEAKLKVGRVLMNDRSFIRDIQESQQELLQFFTPEYVKSHWVKSFLPLVEDRTEDPLNKPINVSLPADGSNNPVRKEESVKKAPSPVPAEKKEHVGLILPVGYRGGTLHAFLEIAKMLKACGYRVTIGLPDDYLKKDSVFYYPTVMDDALRKLENDTDIPIRFYSWEQLSPIQNEDLRMLACLRKKKEPDKLFNGMMNDHVNCFCECDRWLFVSDRLFSGIPMPLRPYSIIVYDFLQRYMPFPLLPPNIENLYLHSTRQAESLFVTNPVTANDMIVYNGIPSRKIFQLPFEFTAKEMIKYSALNRTPFKNKRPYIVWACNRAWHKNHVRVLYALIRYYSEFCGKLEVFITGVDTADLDYKNQKKKDKEKDEKKNSPAFKMPQHVIEFQELFKKNKDILKKNVHIKGELDRNTYFDLLAGAEFLLLSSISDNGAFGAVEAAWLGVPCASSDYPHMRYMAQYFGITPLWYKGEKIDSITDALNKMPQCSAEYRKTIPSHEKLEALSYEHHQQSIQKTLREAWS